ncbi:MAG: hypothetical protein IJT60_01010, partial [Clostridia bacterium]|nr:hypothetical protein [Clostridia bacterium]
FSPKTTSKRSITSIGLIAKATGMHLFTRIDLAGGLSASRAYDLFPSEQQQRGDLYRFAALLCITSCFVVIDSITSR